MFTPEGSVGIGGVYMCIYGMDSPGGYQLVGRTLPIWNKYTENPYFEKGKPWLLRYFDQIQYYQVSDDELTDLRDRFSKGVLDIEVSETTIKPKEVNTFLKSIDKEVKEFRKKQDRAFTKEREHWEASGMIGGEEESILEDASGIAKEQSIPDGYDAVKAHTSGVVWDILVEPNQCIEKDKAMIILSAMKTEITITSERTYNVQEVAVKKGQLVSQGDILFIVKERTEKQVVKENKP